MSDRKLMERVLDHAVDFWREGLECLALKRQEIAGELLEDTILDVNRKLLNGEIQDPNFGDLFSEIRVQVNKVKKIERIQLCNIIMKNFSKKGSSFLGRNHKIHPQLLQDLILGGKSECKANTNLFENHLAYFSKAIFFAFFYAYYTSLSFFFFYLF